MTISVVRFCYAEASHAHHYQLAVIIIYNVIFLSLLWYNISRDCLYVKEHDMMVNVSGMQTIKILKLSMVDSVTRAVWHKRAWFAEVNEEFRKFYHVYCLTRFWMKDLFMTVCKQNGNGQFSNKNEGKIMHIFSVQ